MVKDLSKAAHNLTIRVSKSFFQALCFTRKQHKMSVEVLQMPTCERYTSRRYKFCTGLTELQVTAMDGSDMALSMLFRDDHCKSMRPWWYYCEKADPDFFKSKPAAAVEETSPAVVEEAPPPPMPTEVTLDEADAEAREAECRAWLAIPRNKRKPYSMGGLVAGANCFNKEDSVVVKGLPADAPTLYGDLREFLGEVAVIIDLYKPAKGPLFIGLLDGKSKKALMDAFPAGLLYKGCVLTLELAMNRSKTSAEMASGKSV